MKKVIFLSLVLLFAALQFVHAKSGNNRLRAIHKSCLATFVNHAKAGGGVLNQIQIALVTKFTAADTAFTPVTGAKAVFDTGYNSNVYGPEDAVDFNAGGFGGTSFSILQGSLYLTIEGRQLPTVKDTVPFIFQNPSNTIYQLQIDGTTFRGNGLTAYLYDSYLNKATVIPDTLINYNLTVDLSNNATFLNRFSVIFKSSSLSISGISLSSILNVNSTVLNWNTIGENNLTSFGVEKSVDGTTYNLLGSVAAKNVFAASYTFSDANTSVGTSYYRIKTTSKNGAVSYSTTSTISRGAVVGANFGVYPNPIKNKTVNLRFNQIAKGNYVVSIYNALGKQVATKQIQHVGGTATYNTNIDAVLISGLYKLSIYSASNAKIIYTTNLLVQN